MSDEPEDKRSEDEEANETSSHAKRSSSEILDREKILREEQRGSIQIYMLVWRTGLTALPTLLVAIGFLRKDYLQLPGPAGALSCSSVSGTVVCMQNALSTVRGLNAIPLYQYLLGTLFLAGVAYLFYRLQRSIADRVLFFSIELNVKCKALTPPYGPSDRGLWQSGLLAFPLFDLFVKWLLWLDEGFGGKWDIDPAHWIVLAIELAICALALIYVRFEERSHVAYRDEKGLNRNPTVRLWEETPRVEAKPGCPPALLAEA